MIILRAGHFSHLPFCTFAHSFIFRMRIIDNNFNTSLMLFYLKEDLHFLHFPSVNRPGMHPDVETQTGKVGNLRATLTLISNMAAIPGKHDDSCRYKLCLTIM